MVLKNTSKNCEPVEDISIGLFSFEDCFTYYPDL